MSRLRSAFDDSSSSAGLIPFITAGYPSLEASLAMLHGFEGLGVRAVEIGIPFSDPIADGPEIQRSSEWALRQGVSVDDVLSLVADYRREGSLPIVLMTYANPVHRSGIDEFAERAQASGVDGVLITDLPADESPETWRALDRAGLDTILLVAPTTSAARLPVVVARCRGFVYCVSRTGVTGRSGGEAGGLASRIAEIRAHTELPVAVGFGIASADDVRRLQGVADAVVVGAAFMRQIAENPETGAVDRVLALAESLVAGLR